MLQAGLDRAFGSVSASLGRPRGREGLASRRVSGAPRSTQTGSRKVDRKSTRLNSSHGYISYAVFCLKKKKRDRKSDFDITQHVHGCAAIVAALVSARL